MFVHNLDPTLLSLGPLEIRWYGVIYVLGFFLSAWWMQYLAKKGKLNLNKEEIWDFLFYLILGVLIGARLFMIFWNPEIYLKNPLNLLKIWQGGMSFHGAFVGIVTVGWWYCKKKNLNFWRMADILSVPTMLGLALGRIANFINGELVGRVWSGKWCVVFPDFGDACRHPSTIYAALKRFVVFGWLLRLSFWMRFREGFIFWNFVFWEGLGRFVVDYFREDPIINGFSLGQWFSLAMVVVAGYMFWKYYQDDWKNIFK